MKTNKYLPSVSPSFLSTLTMKTHDAPNFVLSVGVEKSNTKTLWHPIFEDGFAGSF
jgi:hypothetical protein